MSFPKSQKILHEDLKYNPPPGYYDSSVNKIKKAGNSHTFNKEERFIQKQAINTHGPGAFYDYSKQQVKKRILQRSKKDQKINENQSSSNIKISSIPSIPKKSATRVYEELAPGILILHEQEYQNTNIGPGTYEISEKNIKKKVVCHKIPPQHKKKFIQAEEKYIPPPALSDAERQQKRLMFKRGLIKSSAIQRNIINPSDLCLEVIILREKLLRGEQVPPPGYYYNQNTFSNFKPLDQEKPPELHLFAGKQQRFKYRESSVPVGPGTYEIDANTNFNGGFIAKQQRAVNVTKPDQKPGPGAYKIQPIQKVGIQPKGKYPPIFGSGCTRFASAPKQSALPGPGSYKLDGKKKKKAKYIKVKRQLYDTKPDLQSKTADDFTNQTKDQSTKSYLLPGYKQTVKNTANFSSKVDRFNQKHMNNSNMEYRNYNISETMMKKSFNKHKQYLGSRQGRFPDYEIRPKIGPGTYQPNYSSVKNHPSKVLM